MLAACKQVEKEKKAKIEELSKEKNPKQEENKTFIYTLLNSEIFLFKDLSNKKNSLDKKKGNYEANLDNFLACKLF